MGPKDLTVETLQPLLKREIHGLMEASRSFGQKRTPYAALSRGVAGYIDNSLVMTLPGSRQGAKESLIAVLPALVHLFDVQKYSTSRRLSIMSGCGADHGLITVDQALELILQHTQVLATERLKLNQALNRYLAEDIYSGINLPLFSQSAVDGYALCTQAAIEPESEFQLIGEIRAGQQDELQLQDGQAVRIFTGAKIPLGTTTVARQEIVQAIDLSRIKITEQLKIHADIRDVGEEISVGQLLANKGQQLSVGAIASLSMAGINTVKVFNILKWLWSLQVMKLLKVSRILQRVKF